MLLQKIFERLGCAPEEWKYTSVGGGSINDSIRLNCSGHHYFCKVNSATKFPQLFEKEKRGLELLSKHHIIRTPAVVDCFELENNQVLVLEWIVPGERSEKFWERFGIQLARLHQVHQEYFGLDENNYMGSVEQVNTAALDWTGFFIHQRLMPLVLQCRQNDLLSLKEQEEFEHLYKRLGEFFEQEQRPSLLHGDLWSGNFMCDQNSEPFLIDPAVYYGHPSVDLGMTTLFGGFDARFYEAYHYYAPFSFRHREQWMICNLYPLLIHLLLFGKSYLSQIQSTLKSFS